MNCVLCGQRIMGRPYETAEGIMCPDSSGCRRTAYHQKNVLVTSVKDALGRRQVTHIHAVLRRALPEAEQ